MIINGVWNCEFDGPHILNSMYIYNNNDNYLHIYMYIYISDFGRHGKSFTTDFLKYLLNQMNEGETDKGCWFGVFKVLNKLASSPVAASPRLHLGFFASCGNLISIDIPFWMG
jgi:hypothetical protein